MSQAAASAGEPRDQRSPCLLVLDLSASRRDASDTGGAVLPRLNAGLRALQERVRAESEARHRIELAVVDAGGAGRDASVLVDWADGGDFAACEVLPATFSHLAEGMRLALQHLDHHMLALRRFGIASTRPWIMVLSHGVLDEPHELWENVARDCREAERQKRCVVFPVLVDGDDAGVLQQVSATPVARMASTAFDAYFEWLCAALVATSRTVAGEPARLPPAQGWARFSG